MEKSAATISHEMLAGLVPLVRGFVESFEEEMREAGLLSYQDSSMSSWRRSSFGRTLPFASRIRESIRHFLVDEFQDTDPLQVELIFLLAGEGDASDWREVLLEDAGLFLVGRSQAIRLPLPPGGHRHLSRSEVRGSRRSRMGRLLHITENFRSTPGVVDFVNEAFSRVIRAETGVQPEYVPLEAHRESAGLAVFLIKTARRRRMSPRTAAEVKEEDRRKERGRLPRRRDPRAGGEESRGSR